MDSTEPDKPEVWKQNRKVQKYIVKSVEMQWCTYIIH